MPLPAKKVPINLQSRARSYTNLCLESLAGIVQNSENDNARVAAAVHLLDRGWGKAPGAAGEAAGEVRVVIRQIIEARGERTSDAARAIEGQTIDQDGTLLD